MYTTLSNLWLFSTNIDEPRYTKIESVSDVLFKNVLVTPDTVQNKTAFSLDVIKPIK